MTAALEQQLLRESGYERHVAPGYLNLLGVSVQDGTFTMVAARWDIYTRGILGADANAEALSVLVLEEVMQQPLHTMTADPFDLVKWSRSRMQGQPGCEDTATCVDLGGADAGGEGYLLSSQIREELDLHFALRTVSDADLPAPTWDAAHRSFRMSPEALTGALAARAGARQVLISDTATESARRVFTDALRQAGAADPRTAPPLTRLVAWVAEIVGRPLLPPLVDLSRKARFKRRGSGPYVRMVW